MERFHGNGLKNLNSAVILKITPPKNKFGLEDGIKSLSWKFELNRTRNRFFKIKQSLGKKISVLDTVIHFFFGTDLISVISVQVFFT